MLNANEAHFIVYFNDSRTFFMKGDDDVKFADVLNRDQGMTMMFMLDGGSRTRMEIPIIAFLNKKCSYQLEDFWMKYQVFVAELNPEVGWI